MAVIEASFLIEPFLIIVRLTRPDKRQLATQPCTKATDRVSNDWNYRCCRSLNLLT